jgi:hypothetical protein
MAAAAAGPASPGPRPVKRAAARAAASATDRSSYKKNSLAAELAGSIWTSRWCQNNNPSLEHDQTIWGVTKNGGSAGRSISNTGQVCHGGDKRQCRYEDDAKNNEKILGDVLFVVVIVGLNSHDFLTLKFVGPALGAAGRCLISSAGLCPKKPTQPIENDDRLLLAQLL